MLRVQKLLCVVPHGGSKAFLLGTAIDDSAEPFRIRGGTVSTGRHSKRWGIPPTGVRRNVLSFAFAEGSIVDGEVPGRTQPKRRSPENVCFGVGRCLGKPLRENPEITGSIDSPESFDVD